MTERDFVADMKMAVARLAESEAFAVWAKQCKAHLRRIQRAKIQTYQAAYDALGNVWLGADLRWGICEILYLIYVWLNLGTSRDIEYIDRRKIVKPLLIALQTKDPSLKSAAIQLACQLELKRAIPVILQLAQSEPNHDVRVKAIEALDPNRHPATVGPLLAIATNRSEPEPIRIAAVMVLACSLDNFARTAIAHLIQDPTEAIEVRAEAAEWLAHWDFPEWVAIQTALLNAPQPRLRIAAAYAFVDEIYDVDISSALPTIDRVLATDSVILANGQAPATEIAPAHEIDWYEHIAPDPSIWVETYLVSPILLYDDFRTMIGQASDREYSLADQPTTLAIDPATLAQQILERWPHAQLNVRQPQPQSVILDWLIVGGEEPLMGGLHRNGYWVLVTALEGATFEFAQWLRGIISAEYPLRLYELGHWAEGGVEIHAEGGDIGMGQAGVSISGSGD